MSLFTEHGEIYWEHTPATFRKSDRKKLLCCSSSKYRKFLPKYRLFIEKKKKKIKKIENYKKINSKNNNLFSQIKNFDFVNSQQNCFTVQNADIRICPIYRKYKRIS